MVIGFINGIALLTASTHFAAVTKSRAT